VVLTIPATVDIEAIKEHLSGKFISDLEKALKQGDDIKRQIALLALFEKYGHVFATRVTLGGSIISSDIQTLHSREQNDSKKGEASGSIKVPFFGGKGGGGSSKEDSSTQSDGDAQQSTKILGGHQTYAPKAADEEPSERWVSSIQNNCKWRIATCKVWLSIHPLTATILRFLRFPFLQLALSPLSTLVILISIVFVLTAPKSNFGR
jgi:hypothetical protein